MNEHIEMNLDKYIALDNLEYAVMLTGKWGSGKTYFIDTFIKKHQKDELKFINISLFGLKQLSEINQKIIFKLFTKKEGSLSDSLLTIGAKLTDSFSKRLNLSINDIPIEQIIQKMNTKFIFVFDDLERTEIKIPQLLGYLNYFIEQANCKVIILANEEEIIDKVQYFDFKEKVIGKTYEIQQDFRSIFDNFLELSKYSKNIFTKNYMNILEIYNKSTYNNLRHIRQGIIDFDYIYNLFDDDYKSNNNFINNFLYVFLSLFIELRKGYLKEEELIKHDHVSWEIFHDKKEKKEKKAYENIIDKYKLLNYDIKMFSNDTWIDLLFKNNINKNNINKIISNTSYFLQYESWYKLYYYWSCEEEEYKEVLLDVTNKFINNKYLEQKELLSIVGLLLYLSKNDLCHLSTDEISTLAKNNIDINCKTKLWEKEKYEQSYRYSKGFYYKGITYSYYEKESDDFKNIEKYLKKQSSKAFDNGLIYKAEQLLFDLKNSNYKNIDIKLNNEFKNIDIFNYINKEEFLNIIQKLPHHFLSSFITFLEVRYENWQLIYNHQILVKEFELWQYIYNNLINNINKNKNPLKYFLLNDFKNTHLRKIIDSIYKAKIELMLKQSTFSINHPKNIYWKFLTPYY